MDSTTLQPNVVAMKIIKMSTNPQTRKYQKKEIDFHIQQAERKLNGHVIIIRYFAFIEYKITEEHCVFMEICKTTLRDIIERDAWGEDEHAVKRHIVQGICEGINYLHKNSIIHRDINPSNILLKNEGGRFHTVKVADFNIFTIHDMNRGELSHTLNVGQEAYRAIEVIESISIRPGDEERAKYGCSVDIWSIGAVVYEMHTKKVFMNLNMQQIFRGKLFDEPTKIDNNVRDPSDIS